MVRRSLSTGGGKAPRCGITATPVTIVNIGGCGGGGSAVGMLVGCHRGRCTTWAVANASQRCVSHSQPLNQLPVAGMPGA